MVFRAHGIDARLDLVAGERRQDWAEWMTREVRDAGRVLVVASPEYKRAAEGDAGPGERRGVQWEARLIRDRFYADQEAGLEAVVPVVLPGCSAADIPVWLAPASAAYYEVSEYTVAGAERLLRLLTGQPWETEPPLGAVPVLPPRGRPPPGRARPGGVADGGADPGPHHRRRAAGVGGVGGRFAAVPAAGAGAAGGGRGMGWVAAAAAAAAQRMAEAGRRLAAALLDDAGAAAARRGCCTGCRLVSWREVVLSAVRGGCCRCRWNWCAWRLRRRWRWARWGCCRGSACPGGWPPRARIPAAAARRSPRRRGWRGR